MVDTDASAAATAPSEARDHAREWYLQPWVHLVAAGLVGAAAGAADGWLAAHRTGLEPLSGAQTTAALMLAVGLHVVPAICAGGVAGVLAWGMGHVVDTRRLLRTILGRRGRIVIGVGLVIVAVAAVLWASSRRIVWDAIDWRLPIIGAASLFAYPALIWLQRRRAVRLAAAALLALTVAGVFVGWSQTGEAATEGLIRIGTESASSKHLLLRARTTFFDSDGDGAPTALCRLDCDCDDSDESIVPGAADIPDNGIDEDCDGRDLTREELDRYESLLARGDTAPGGADDETAAHAADARAQEETPDADASRRARPDIVFVTIDTLRADHLGYEGYERPTSPNLDALAARGVVFRQARATGPQTRFSVPSMLTSKYFTELERTPSKWPRIADEEVLVSEVLADMGYHTAAWHSVSYFAELYGMNQGFEHYDATALRARYDWRDRPTSDYVTDRVLEYVDSPAFAAARAGRPLPQEDDDANNPGGAESPPHGARAGGADARSDIVGSADDVAERGRRPFFFWAYYGDPHSSYLFHEGFDRFGPSRADAYDAEIQFTDHHVGRLLDGLEARGLLDDAIVIVTSDHGEGLDEAEDHGHRYHGPVLYDEAMRVPLIFAGPGLAPRHVNTPVSLIDLMPTILDLAGADLDAYEAAAQAAAVAGGATTPESGVRPRAPQSMRGISLRPWLEGMTHPHPPVFFEKHKESALPQKGMVLWPYKVILVLPYNKLRIYDLEKDPRERTEIRRELPEQTREELVGLLKYWSSQVLQPVEPRERK